MKLTNYKQDTRINYAFMTKFIKYEIIDKISNYLPNI